MEHAKLVEGIWFPEHDRHLSSMVANHSKIGTVTLKDGRKVGTYQKHKLDFALKHLPFDRRRCAVDVGGHVGLWSMHFGDLFERVEAFEPLPEHWRLFEVNLNNNRRVHLHPIGLGSAPGEISLVVDPLNTGNTHMLDDESDFEAEERMSLAERKRLHINADDGGIHIEHVRVAMLDSFNFPNVDLIKIDVEGAELEVVKGARKTILRCRPMMIIEQKGNDAKFHGGALNAAGQYLLDMGARLIKNYGGDWIMDFPR